MSDVPIPALEEDSSRAHSSDIAEQLRGFGPVGLLALLIILAGNLLILPLSAVFVLIWARLSHTAWGTLGFARPRSWTRIVAIGIPFGIAFTVCSHSGRRLRGRNPVSRLLLRTSGQAARCWPSGAGCHRPAHVRAVRARPLS